MTARRCRQPGFSRLVENCPPPVGKDESGPAIGRQKSSNVKNWGVFAE
jgi:hypothetical protein